jgi:hypothetical protein
MKRAHNDLQNTVPHKIELLPEIQDLIINFLTHNTIEKKPKDAAYPVNALARTNKRINALINNPNFSDSLINAFAQKFYCSHETIARYLATQQAQKRLLLQYELKDMCNFRTFGHDSMTVKNWMSKSLDRLITQKIDLEFTFNHHSSRHTIIQTPLITSVRHNTIMFFTLLEKGANINGCTSHDLTPLGAALEYPIDPLKYKIILKHPGIAINQQNKRGETALLHCLLRRQRLPAHLRINHFFIQVIANLLTAGADPELANKAGVTSLMAAKELKDDELIRIIENAIEQKARLAQQIPHQNPTQ